MIAETRALRGFKPTMSVIPADALAQEITEILLHHENLTAKEIHERIGTKVTRTDINLCLHETLAKQGLVVCSQDTPPRWRMSFSSGVNPASLSVKTIVLVDLGNVHDCLKSLIPYAQQGSLEVYAFADFAFQGFGVNPPLLPCERLHLIQAKTADRNAADLELIWTVARYCFEAEPGSCRFFVATKDAGFQSLAAKAEQYGHSLTFVTSWASLRLHIE